MLLVDLQFSDILIKTIKIETCSWFTYITALQYNASPTKVAAVAGAVHLQATSGQWALFNVVHFSLITACLITWSACVVRIKY